MGPLKVFRMASAVARAYFGESGGFATSEVQGRAYFGESGGFAPSEVQGQSPWSGDQGAKPPEADEILANYSQILHKNFYEMWLNSDNILTKFEDTCTVRT
jgi:hypothetical protein